jgi:hypothetical protein
MEKIGISDLLDNRDLNVPTLACLDPFSRASKSKKRVLSIPPGIYYLIKKGGYSNKLFYPKCDNNLKTRQNYGN